MWVNVGSEQLKELRIETIIEYTMFVGKIQTRYKITLILFYIERADFLVSLGATRLLSVNVGHFSDAASVLVRSILGSTCRRGSWLVGASQKRERTALTH